MMIEIGFEHYIPVDLYSNRQSARSAFPIVTNSDMFCSSLLLFLNEVKNDTCYELRTLPTIQNTNLSWTVS